MTFDPKFELESVGIEHVSGLELTMEGVLLSSWDRAKDISKHLKLLKETAHHLKYLTIICKDLCKTMREVIRWRTAVHGTTGRNDETSAAV